MCLPVSASCCFLPRPFFRGRRQKDFAFRIGKNVGALIPSLGDNISSLGDLSLQPRKLRTNFWKVCQIANRIGDRWRADFISHIVAIQIDAIVSPLQIYVAGEFNKSLGIMQIDCGPNRSQCDRAIESPVSKNSNSNRSATFLAMLLFPAPAGPSIVTITLLFLPLQVQIFGRLVWFSASYSPRIDACLDAGQVGFDDRSLIVVVKFYLPTEPVTMRTFPSIVP